MTRPFDTVRRTLPIPESRPPTTATLDIRDTSYPPLDRLRPPDGAPNVVVVLIDDMGFGASSAFGGPCAMPTAERLAAGGLKYTRFHTTALCSPTRAALMTGRNHHAVNMGTVTNLATSTPGYTAVRPQSAATLAEVLRLNGYSTGAFGKMHQTPPWEISPVGPFDRWPTGEGFERFYGFLGGEMNHWEPLLFDGTQPVEPPDTDDYHLSDDITDRAIGWMRTQHALAPAKPFFMYLSFGATHAPHHAPKEWIDKYRNRFDQGWDREREVILERQRAAGVVPDDCVLTQRHDDIPAWDELDGDEQAVAARLMETYAAFAEHTDHQVGRLVDALEASGTLENTIFLYLLGDNGASGGGGTYGSFNETASLNGVREPAANMVQRLDEAGGPTAYNNFPTGWAHATNTPYQWFKQVASHWGGTRVGLVAHWPAGVSAAGEVRHQWHHVNDVYPTILEAAGIPIPETVNGTPQQRIDGVSMCYTFDEPGADERRTTQYFEMFGNRGIYHDGWSACTKHLAPGEHAPEAGFRDDRWELYAPDDWSQAHDIAGEQPEKLIELQQLFLAEAEKNSVLPLDDRRVERFIAQLAGRPDLNGGRGTVELHAGMRQLNDNCVPDIKNKSHSIRASIVLPDSGADGVVLSQGGRFGGWSLFLSAGVPVYCHNWLGFERFSVRADYALAPGRHELVFTFDYDGGGFGKGGTGTLAVDGAQVAQARIARTVPFRNPTSDTTDVGIDLGTPVTDEYRTEKGRFSGRIEWVRITADGDGPAIPPGVAQRIEVATQ
ncbi:arylsulfatase [Streptomyces sp. NBC_01306]|uniref:arylsulfatase n=1 Tax=Streptomyces sp. NBC_01306 TaxID=2903819 RepID=UPI00225C0390|nr:arylsulfatase [Streptomyces sp. NBC_01306]MCX4724184.1 arylsulfatase [Streptomyces sp. NBC_01306]